MKTLNFKHLCFLLIVMLCAVFSVQAQTRGARVTNEITGAKEPSSFAILDLSSVDKGFLLPRMSTSQRDEIKIDKKANNGLAIFNTTTDCIEYFNQSLDMWMSLCGDDLPAEFSILPNLCSDIKIMGGYYKNIPLNQSNGILVKVSATTSGTYSIYVDSKNGYSFSQQGKFPAPGVYSIYLKGEGKPIKSYLPKDKGDRLVIQLNGSVSKCEKYNFVDEKLPEYTILKTKTIGHYFVEADVTDDEYLEVEVNVTSLGKYVMKTNKDNGVRFEGEGYFTNTGIQKVNLPAIGTPKIIGNTPLKLESNPQYGNGLPQQEQLVSFNTKGFGIKLNCAFAEYTHTTKANVPLNENAIMTIKVDVEAPGKTILTASNTSGGKTLIFRSNETNFTFDRKNPENNKNVEVKLYVDKTQKTPGTYKNFELEVKGEGLLTNATCNNKVQMPIQANELDWDILRYELITPHKYQLSSSKSINYITPRTLMNSSYFINVYLKVKSPGTINMKTNTINGISFSGSLKTTDAHIGKTVAIKLIASGTSIRDLPSADAKFEITSNHINETQRKTTFEVDFVYRPMNFLGLGADSPFVAHYDPNTNIKSAIFANQLLLNPNLFSWDGLVRIAEIRFIPITSNFNSSGTTVEKVLIKTDISLTTGTRRKDVKVMEVLANRVLNNNLAYIYCEVDKSTGNVQPSGEMLKFLKKFSSTTVSKSSQSNNGERWKMQDVRNNPTSPSDPFITLYDSKFFKLTNENKTILNSDFGVHTITADGQIASFAINSVPTNFKALYQKSSSNITGLIHEKLGLITLFNGHPYHGNSSDLTPKPVSPLKTKVDPNNSELLLPLAWTNYNTQNSPAIYNAHHFLNTVYWAIDYAQANQPNVDKPL